MKVMELNNVRKSFAGAPEVLKDISIEVDKGEVVAIIGPSGSGKSTLLRCATLLTEMDGGELSYSGERAAWNDENGKTVYAKDLKKIRSYFGLVFQNFNLFPHYTALENIAKPYSTVKKVPMEEAKSKARELLQKVHLEGVDEQFPATLSGGQKQRIAIARALGMEPSIMIFDEPTSALDPELAHEVFKTITELAKEGQTMLVVTHQINAIQYFANRVAFLDAGKIEVDGTPEYVFGECDNPKLKNFLDMVDFREL